MKKYILLGFLLLIAGMNLTADYHIAWVTAEPDTIYVDDNLTFSEIEVCIYDENDDPVSGERVDFDCNLGSCLGYDFTNGLGIAETTFWESDDGPGVATIMISVDNTILGEVEVTILPLVSADDDIPLLTEIKNFPNPFQANGSRGTGTTISFSFKSGTKTLNEPAEVSVYNMKGQLVRKLNTDLNSAQSSYSVHWDGRNNYGTIAESGIYLYTISVQDHIFKGKMTLLK